MRRRVVADMPLDEERARLLPQEMVEGLKMWRRSGSPVYLIETAAQALLAGHPSRIADACDLAMQVGPIYIGPEEEWRPDGPYHGKMTWDGSWIVPGLFEPDFKPGLFFWSMGADSSNNIMATNPRSLHPDSDLDGETAGVTVYRIAVNAFAAIADRVVVEPEEVSDRRGRRLIRRGKSPGRHGYRVLRLTRDAEHTVEQARRKHGLFPLRPKGVAPGEHQVHEHMQRYWVKTKPENPTETKETPHGTRYAVWREKATYDRGAGTCQPKPTTIIKSPA